MSEGALPVAILAGGLATRLRPLTETLPKALIDINGEPFIAHQLRLLRSRGIERVVVCAGHLGDMIQASVGGGGSYDLQVDFSFDGARLLGTAGAIRRALPLLGERFFVLYGDSYLPCDYRSVQRAFLAADRLGLMTVFRNEGRWDRSNIEFSDGRLVAYDKERPTERMRHIDYGLSAFRREAFADAPADQPSDLAWLCQRLLAQDQLGGFEVFERFYEIGSPAGLEELRRHLGRPTDPGGDDDDR
jgi:NDP-sugar pyrophosphorylase family protein